MRIQEWNKKFQELLDEMPPGYWLFAASGTLYLMRLKNGERIVDRNDGMSQSAIVREFYCPNEIDGGDW